MDMICMTLGHLVLISVSLQVHLVSRLLEIVSQQSLRYHHPQHRQQQLKMIAQSV